MEVDPCEATIAVTSASGMLVHKEYRPDPGDIRSFLIEQNLLVIKNLH